MTEVEVKILEIDQAAIELKLQQLGAVKVFEGDVEAMQFDFADGSLRNQDSFLRLRSKGSEVELAYKKKVESEGAKTYQETEVLVSDLATTRMILEKIGLTKSSQSRKKHRISYSLEDAHFEIDTFENIPTFLEIEVSDITRLQYWVELLGYTMTDTKPWSGKAVHKHYGISYPRA